MNSFYNLPKRSQWFWAILLFLIFIGLFMLWTILIMNNPLWIILIFVLVSLQHLFLTPWIKLSGTYEYLSPMLLVFKPNEKEYDLHNGTSFDYLWVMRGVKVGAPLRNKLLAYYFEGLLKIIEQLEEGKIPPTVVIKGSSYFFSERTAKRLGFEIFATDGNVRFNIVLNYLDLIWMYSLSRGKLSFPKIKDVQTAQITGEKLLLQKVTLERYRQYFSRYV
jgi:hypothetical protein